MENEKTKYTIEQLRQALEEKGYTFFESEGRRAYNLNIIGVRHSYHISNEFDDLLYLVFSDKFGGELQIHEFPITTDPGYYYLKHPMHVCGTAILVPGQYLGAYAIGKHNQQYKALCQIGKVKVWREKRDIHDINPHGPIYDDVGGINIHRTKHSGSSKYVNKWSAGCQVFRNAADFDFFMGICDASKANHGSRFTYTLLMASDIPKS